MGFFKAIRPLGKRTRPKTARKLVRDVTKAQPKGTPHNKVKFGRKSKGK
jgi:hypothetical protein